MIRRPVLHRRQLRSRPSLIGENPRMEGNVGVGRDRSTPQVARSALNDPFGADSLRALQVLSLFVVSDINQLLQARLRRAGGG